jgi:hypothetical protein
MPETASWPQAMEAVDLHKNRKLAKKYVESPMVRG